MLLEFAAIPLVASILSSATASKIVKDKKYLNELDIAINKKLNTNLSQPKAIEGVIEGYKNNDIVLVLGAGISVDYEIPSWNDLLQKLFLETIKEETTGSDEYIYMLAKLFTTVFPRSPLISGRYLKNYYNKENVEFEQLVRKNLYENIKDDTNSELIKEIVQLCVSPGNSPNLNSIITYNYDDIIEESLSKLDIDVPYKSVYYLGENTNYNELPIYHVHGFIPRGGILDKRNKITLSEDIYHEQYSDIYSWNNMVQINKFRDNTCLFIGNSLTDPNLRRLLDIAKVQKGDSSKYHYLIKRMYDNAEIEEYIKGIMDRNENVNSDDKVLDSDIRETAEKLISILKKFEESDAQSFGIQIIWVDQFDEIPILLRQIRKMGK